jgi:hypothetical protein
MGNKENARGEQGEEYANSQSDTGLHREVRSNCQVKRIEHDPEDC